MTKPRMGLLTGGGDAPGLNGILEGTALPLLRAGYELVGIEDGFEGVFSGRVSPITEDKLRGAHIQAGTLLGTSNKCGTQGREAEFLSMWKQLKLDGLIVAGGDGTFKGLQAFQNDIRMIGVPKTIDNDLSGTEVTFGFDTACSVVAEAVDELRMTAEAHRRVLVVETMGREAGWIALGGGLAGYADAILVPERPYTKRLLAQHLKEKLKQGRRGLVVVVSEGAHAEGEKEVVHRMVEGSPEVKRLGGISQQLALWIEEAVGCESRNVVLGHLQRSRYPTTTDRFLTLAMGVEASQMVMDGAWGQAVVYRNGRVQRAPMSDLMGPPRVIDPDHRWVKLAKAVGIFI